MRVAQRRIVSRSSERLTSPSIETKAKGGSSSSTMSATRPSCCRLVPLTVLSPVVKRRSSPSRVNQIGATWGRPSARTVANAAVRVPSSKKARVSSGVIWCTGRSYGSWNGATWTVTSQLDPQRIGLRGRRRRGAPGLDASADLEEHAEKILDVPGLDDLSVLQMVDVDGHEFDLPTSTRDPE